MSDLRVTVTRDGPYVVTGRVALALQTIVADAKGGSTRWAEGRAFDPQDKVSLCRCGHSGNKPFCDGSHRKVGFDGTETASREPYESQAKTFPGPVFRLRDAEALCSAARFCDTHDKVWNEVAHTDDEATRATFVEQVHACPSGRLVAVDAISGKSVEPVLPVSIGLVEDPQEACSGPLWLRGRIPVVGADGHAYEVRNRVTLCRCGVSRNKPFCDGSHVDAKFSDGLA